MYYRDGSLFDDSYPPSTSQKWDPVTVLELFNYAKMAITCPGTTKKKRRCRNPIAQHNLKHSLRVLNGLASEPASKAATSPELCKPLGVMLCYHHHRYLSDILCEWQSRLNDWAARHDESDEDTESDVDSDVDSDTNTWRPDYTPRGEPYVTTETLEYYILYGYTRREREREDARQRRADEKRRRKEEKRKREEEQRRKEEERKRKEEERKRKEEEKRRKEEEARERAFRERVRLAEEQKEREAREKAKRESEEWRSSWDRYSRGWNSSADLVPGSIPWPVKSGRRSDVNEVNVKQFFAKAPPESLVDSSEKRFKLMNAENKRWHTDKIMQRFGLGVLRGSAKPALDTIAKTLIELRQEAQRNR
ncbi:hypothetical protein F5Y00DRAFT_270867 [Daldinia vernicosa]|uniref:uncharacterized protein n=1 Tax=Daldinia vernicosa TaxID=114800 RepID=UPI0020073374|nr:uncharacterized protein F5Y00DRAFT_270867 [Daldinia vernicosa]KAI0847954.1 hypothetical protein F5Y00DRAFT_270867 [Daldinia vernicosa]